MSPGLIRELISLQQKRTSSSAIFNQINGTLNTASLPFRSVPLPQTQLATLTPPKPRKKNPSSNTPNSTPRKPKKNPSPTKTPKAKNVEKKNPQTVFYKFTFDTSKVPVLFCSCTGLARPCYKCGASGWQSLCCNSSLSEYPLPMSVSRPGVCVSGRKMSSGAYQKLLYKLVAADHDASRPVDLKDHWAKHGTNKFVTIK